MINGTKITGAMLENFMKSYKFNSKGELEVVNETFYAKAKEQLSEMLKNTTREWWIQLESSEGSLAKMADEIDFEQKEGNPSKLSNKVAKSKDEDKDEDEGSDEVTESFDFNSIFEDGDVHIHNYGNNTLQDDMAGTGGSGTGSFTDPEPGDHEMGTSITGGETNSVVPTMTFANPSSGASGMSTSGNDPSGAINAGNTNGMDEAGDDFDFDLSFLEEPEAGEKHKEPGSEESEGGEDEMNFGDESGEEEPEGDDEDIDDISFDEPKDKKETKISFGKEKEVEEADDSVGDAFNYGDVNQNADAPTGGMDPMLHDGPNDQTRA
jgi:hypothetical protein